MIMMMRPSLRLLRRATQIPRAASSRLTETTRWFSSATTSDNSEDSDALALPDHIKFRMPDFDFENISGGVGTVTLSKWRVREGDPIADGTTICEIDTPDLTFSLESGDAGFLARILVPEDTKDVPPGQPLAIIVPTQADIQPFLDALQQHPKVIEGYEEPVPEPTATAAVAAPVSDESDGAAVLRRLSALHKEGHFEDDKIYKMLKSLARKNDAQLLVTYRGSFDATSESFDVDFFVETALELAEEAIAASETSA